MKEEMRGGSTGRREMRDEEDWNEGRTGNA